MKSRRQCSGSGSHSTNLGGTWGLRSGEARGNRLPICQKFANIRPKAQSGGRPWACFPFQRLQIDYANMPPAEGFKHLLVIMDQLSEWVKAFPTRKADTAAVVKALVKDIIPRYRVLEVRDSDRGSHFSAGILKKLYQMLEIHRELHTPYRPQSSGLVERMNQTLKNKIARVCSHTGLKWPAGSKFGSVKNSNNSQASCGALTSEGYIRAPVSYTGNIHPG